MQQKPTERLRSLILATATAASLAAGLPSAAHADPGPDEVSVAIVDSNIRRIDFDDPNVRIVDLTPKQAPEGTSFMKYKINDAYSHGDIVASSFVREYRKLDQSSPITIYVVDPFVRKDGNASATFSMRILNDALPRMREAGVRVAVTAFGVADPAAGQKIADAFARNGLALFAAVPNDDNDRGIYPAATPGVISVASEHPGGAFESSRDMSKWVSFSISGSHGSSHNMSDAEGTSFSVAHAGAYGAYAMKRRPETKPSELASVIAASGRRMPGMVGGREKATFRIGGSEMIRTFLASIPSGTPSKGPAQGIDVAALQIASRSGAGR